MCMWVWMCISSKLNTWEAGASLFYIFYNPVGKGIFLEVIKNLNAENLFG